MKPWAKTVALVLLIAAATGIVTYRAGSELDVQDALEKRDALTWLRADFQLNDEQFAKVRALHESYSTVCEQHCRAIQEAATARNAIKASASPNSEVLAAAEKRLEELRQTCENAIAGHVNEVASVMSPEAGRRYLALVLPKIADFDHRAAPDLQMTSHRHP